MAPMFLSIFYVSVYFLRHEPDGGQRQTVTGELLQVVPQPYCVVSFVQASNAYPSFPTTETRTGNGPMLPRSWLF